MRRFHVRELKPQTNIDVLILPMEATTRRMEAGEA
jgi:hypothetical protein